MVLRLILSRIVAGLPVALVVALIVNLILYISPGDPAATIAGDYATPEQVAEIRARLGLDQGFFVQFYHWFARALTGDLGQSIFFGTAVTELIGQRVGPTAALATLTLVVAVPLAIALGVVAAWREGGRFDQFFLVFSITGFSIPVFVLGYLLVYLFAVKAQLLPVQGYVPLNEDPGAFLAHLVLPAIALGVTIVAFLGRMARATMIGVLQEDYIRTARAKGLSEPHILFGHALKNAAMPIITTIGATVAMLIGGVVVTETVFSIPGLGRLVVDAVLQRDYPIVQGVTLFFSVVYLLINLLVDIAYVLVDPRVKF